MARSLPRTIAAVPAAVFAALFLFASPEKAGRRAWDLDLSLRTEGRYKVIVRGVTYSGDFGFTLSWSGTMEEDDDDFRLVQRDIRLLDWRAHETSAAHDAETLKMTGDYPDLPAFHHVFVLADSGFFHLDFALSGLSVPVHESGDKTRLALPRTAGSVFPDPPVHYDAHIRKGSNAVRLPLALISGPTVERTFDWSFEHRQWSLTQDQPLFLSNAHRVKVALRIGPRGTDRT